MRKIALGITLICITIITVNAQTDNRVKPIEGNWGFSLNISGIINNIVIDNNKDSLGNYNIAAKHYLKDDLALRIGFGTGYLRKGGLSEDSVTLDSGNRALEVVDSSISRFDFKVSVGIEKHLGTTKRLDPYVGGELSIIRIGARKTNIDLSKEDVTGIHKEKTTINQDGGAGFGLSAIAGFNYFISKNLSLGVEFGYAYTYVKSGGDYNNNKLVTPVNGEESSTSVFGKASTSKTSIGATATSGITLSFFF